jgi:CheY-like chemotaxis protein
MEEKLKVEVVPLSQVPPDHARLPRECPLILIVDDEKVIADTLAVILSKSGFRTVAAYNAISATEIAADVTPDLLISDVVMPGMSGIDLAIHIKETIPTCKILLFSGQAATVDLLEEARRNGHNFTTLTKPVHPTDLLRRINESLTNKPPIITEPAATETLAAG